MSPRLRRLAVLTLGAVAACVGSLPAMAAEAPAKGLPLPAAMIRLSIPDVRAFDAALGGGFRQALEGTLPDEDGVKRGFNQSQIGAKLNDQWSRFRGDNTLSFQTVRDMQATSLAFAVLNIGQMEMVLVLETPLATLPAVFEAGASRIDHGRTYHLVRTGAADEGSDGETRMGLAWARDEGRLVIATSERAMKLALTAAATGTRFAPKLEGLAGLELDMDALRKDLYFKRDFLFGSVPGATDAPGVIHAALRLEAGRLVEVREGSVASAPSSRGVVFDAPDAVASGWIADGSRFLLELRRGLLEPVSAPSDRPQPAIAPLPSAKAASADDRYLTSIEVPATTAGSTETAELDAWAALLQSQPVRGFGYVVTKSRARLLAFPWPKERETELTSLIEATLSRRGARLAPGSTGDVRQFQMGPGLPALGFRRAGEFVWLAPSASDLRTVPSLAWSDEVARFARLDLKDARDEGKRWARIEGPVSPDTTRPFADRILGLLGWMPGVNALEVERRVGAGGFRERVVFAFAPPKAPAAATSAPAK